MVKQCLTMQAQMKDHTHGENVYVTLVVPLYPYICVNVAAFKV